jgi:hypothetical protein
LFAANALIAHGPTVVVYEQAPALGEIGDGVSATACLMDDNLLPDDLPAGGKIA